MGPGVSVALYLPNVPYHPISFFAVLRAGGRVVHLSPLDPARSLARKLGDSGARILVAPDYPTMLPPALALLADGLLDHLVVGQDAAWGPGRPRPASRRTRAIVPFDRLSEARRPAPGRRWTPDDVAVLQYTGGTTGLPRAAMLTHANLTAATSIYEAWFDGRRAELAGRRPGDRRLAAVPHLHADHRAAALPERGRGDHAPPAVRRGADAGRHRDGACHPVPGVPTMFIAMAAQPGLDQRDLSSLRTASCGGAPLPVEVAQRFEALTGRRVGGGWGMTETSPAGTTILPDMAMRPGLIGVPLPGIEMDVADLPTRIASCRPGRSANSASAART